MGSKNSIGGVQPPLLQSASSHFSRLSGILPESGEEEGPSRCSEGNGDERGDRSRKDSFSGLLQSALFSAKSRGDIIWPTSNFSGGACWFTCMNVMSRRVVMVARGSM